VVAQNAKRARGVSNVIGHVGLRPEYISSDQVPARIELSDNVDYVLVKESLAKPRFRSTWRREAMGVRWVSWPRSSVAIGTS
jgi:hypothetical protein